VSGVGTVGTDLGLEKAGRHLARGDGRLALAELDTVARRDPQASRRPDWWHLRIRAVWDCGDRELALEGTARALAMWPDEPELLRTRAELLAEDGRLAEAEDLARDLLRDQPEHPQALATYAIILSRGGEHRAAETLLARALRHDPEDPNLLRIRFALASAAGVSDAELARQLDGLLAVAPEDPHVLHMESIRALAEGRASDARNAAFSAARSMPGDEEIIAAARRLAVLEGRSMWLVRQTQRSGWQGAWPYVVAFVLGAAVTLGLGVVAVALLWAYCRYWPRIVLRRRGS
jgi:tetratricopeptide (TPR) repeat protein